MNDLNWKYGKNSLIGVELESYNTLYVDKASFHNNGLILQQKDKVIGFISLDKILGILQKTFVSKTGIPQRMYLIGSGMERRLLSRD